MKKFLSKFLDKTFLRFVIVGVINTIFGTAIMFVFYNVFHLSYWISSASNYFFGSILSYFLNKHFTVVIAHFKREFCRNILICVVERMDVKSAVHCVDIDCDGRVITP